MTHHTANHSHFGRFVSFSPAVRRRRGRGMSLRDTLLLRLGGLVYRLTRDDTARIETYSGRSIDDLSRDDLERALLHLGIGDDASAADDRDGPEVGRHDCNPPSRF